MRHYARRSSADPLADEVMIGDRPLAWKAAETTPNPAGRRRSKDDLHRAVRLRYLEPYRHCVAWSDVHSGPILRAPSTTVAA